MPEKHAGRNDRQAEKKAKYNALMNARLLYRQQKKELRREYKQKRALLYPEEMIRASGKGMYRFGEEVFNAVTHGIGAILSIIGLIFLMIMLVPGQDSLSISSAVIYGSSLTLLYIMSTLYHAITHVRAKRVLRIFDHCTIYLLIAGTYTPYTLIALSGPWGYTLFAVIWAMAVLGIVLNAVNMERFKAFSAICYLGMGWAALTAISPLLESLQPGGLTLMLLGGVFYTLGMVFYAMKKVSYMHAIWHLFVLAGSMTHYFGVLFYVYR